MIDQEYRKRLLIERIQTQRERVGQEIKLFKESGPVATILILWRALDSVWHAVGPGVAVLGGGLSGFSRRGRLFGLDLALLLPLLLQLVNSILRRRKGSR